MYTQPTLFPENRLSPCRSSLEKNAPAVEQATVLRFLIKAGFFACLAWLTSVVLTAVRIFIILPGYQYFTNDAATCVYNLHKLFWYILAEQIKNLPRSKISPLRELLLPIPWINKNSFVTDLLLIYSTASRVLF